MELNKYQKVCLVTPEIEGLTDSGRIGSYCLFLARFLAETMNQQVTVLLTSDDYHFQEEIETVSEREKCQKLYQDKWGIEVVYVSELPPMFQGQTYQVPLGSLWFVERSHKIYYWLKQQDFAVCYFQEYQANGFISIQAKRTGQAFAQTTLICLLQGASEWLKQQKQQLPRLAEADLILDWTERYCVEFADAVISPTEAMLTYLAANDWKISEKTAIIPHLFESNISNFGSDFTGKQIIFWGDFDTISGLEIFLKSLRQLAPWLQETERQIDLTFLGKNIADQDSQTDGITKIRNFLDKFDELYSVRILTQLSPAETLDFLQQQSAALVIIASALESLPYPLIASLELNLNVIAANCSGSREIFADESRLFDLRPDYLADKIKECILTGLSPLSKKYSAEKARELWHQWVFNLAEIKPSNYDIINNYSLVAISKLDLPLISVCIPYYNAGRYLPQLLSSLDQQTYKNYEVIIIDDGSTEGYSQQVFQDLQICYQQKNWQFLSQENGGVGTARNAAAQQAKGTYLIFMDADNVAEKEMIQKMVGAILAAKLDCLTCYNRMFYESENPFSANYQHAYTPTGNCREVSLYLNCFGDANFIIKKDVFRKLGGFLESRLVTWEDWEFLTRLTLQGYQLDVIPEFLFFYRLRDDSMSQITSGYYNRLTAIGPLLKTLPKWTQRFALNSVGSLESLKYQNHCLHKQQQAAQAQLKLLGQQLQSAETQLQLLGQQLGQQQQSAETQLQLLGQQLQTAHRQIKRLQRYREQVKQKQEKIQAMESSKFWKMRQKWLRFKQFFRLPTDNNP